MQPKHVAAVSHWQHLYVVLDCLTINACLLAQRDGIYETTGNMSTVRKYEHCRVVLGSQIIRGKTDGTCGKHEGEEKIIHGCGGEI
jgi:hypothetical protein